MTSSRYRGFRIITRPYQIKDSKRWTVDFEIHRHGRHKSFSLIERCDTEKQADASCVWLGRGIIDSRIPGQSISYLRMKTRRPGRRVLVLTGAVLLTLGSFAIRTDPGDHYSGKLVSRAVHTATRQLEDLSGWLFDRVVAAPLKGERDVRIE